MEEKERNFYDRFKDVVSAYVFHDPNAQAATAMDRATKKKTVDERSFALFMESAEAGHPFSCFNIGSCYEKGLNVDKDLEKAYEWYRKAAAGGDVNAWLALGRMFDTGTYVDRDPDTAVMWLTRAADKGHPIALISMAQKYTRGEVVEKDHAKALEFFEKAYEKDKRIGAYMLGEAIGDGIGCEKSYEKAVELFREAHENQFPLATYNLGMMLEMGLGCEKDEKKGFELIKQAADEGIPEAMYRIAFHYREGTSEAKKKDDKIAFEYYKKAADKDFPPACVEAGLCYENGVGTEVNKEEAFRCYEKGAKAGLHTAIVCLAVCYGNGIGCEKDDSKFVELVEQGVALGNTRAYYLLGRHLLYESPYDERGINLEMVAAKAGFARAALFLGGYFIQKGEAGPNKERAEHYFRLASQYGEPTSKFELAELLDTEENKENAEVQEELRKLYQESADSGHPLAAYKTAIRYKNGEGADSPALAESRAIHYMCVAAAGGIPEAAREIAERCFWGDKMQVNLKSACGLYRLAGEELGAPGLTAKYAFTRIITLGEWLYNNIGYGLRIFRPAIQKEQERVRNDEKFQEALKTLTDLASQDVPEARSLLTVVRVLVMGSDLSSEEEKKDLAYIDSLLPSREKRYVQGLLAALLHPDQPKEAIDLLISAKDEFGAGNLHYILGNLYETLAQTKRKSQKTDVLVLAPSKKEWIRKAKKTKEDYVRSARELYLLAYKNGETKSTAKYYYAHDQMLNIEKYRTYVKAGCLCALIGVLLFFYFMWDRKAENGSLSASDFSGVAGWSILYALLAFIVMVVAIDLIMEVSKRKARKGKNQPK